MIPRRKPKDPEEGEEERHSKHPVGRPPLVFPDPIPDTPENIARIVLNTNPKKRGEWRFEKQRARKSDK